MTECYFKDKYSGACNLIDRKNCLGCKWRKTREQYYNDMEQAEIKLSLKGLRKYVYKNPDGKIHVKAVKI